MSLIRLENVTKRYESTLVLREVYFQLSRRDRIGLIGKNGSGKTTALKLLLGQEEPDEGSVSIEANFRIGYFSQFSELSGEKSILDILEELFGHIHALQADLKAVGESLGNAESEKALNRLLARQASLLEEMELCEGWTYKNRIETVLSRLGFSDYHQRRPIEHLSGGWKNRAALAKILLEEPDVLLMDEPTNYLDIDGQAWLETWFKKFKGGLIVVSHDRQFLDSVVTGIVEIGAYHFYEYPGDYTEYIRKKRTRIKTLERQFQHEEELLAFESEAIADRREAQKDPSAALKRKMAHIKRRSEPRPVDRIVTSVYRGIHVPNVIAKVTELSKEYDDQLLFLDLSFDIERGDRIVVIGPNGCGKSTLIKCIVDQVAPDTGDVALGKSISMAYFNQINDELDPHDTVTHAVNIYGLAYQAPRKAINRFLQLMRFTEENLYQRIGTLSGGERARVALAKCLLSGAGLIVLDEPTNHLDITSAQVIERALINFPGAVVVVSHDRFFIDKVATRLLVFDGTGQVDQISGNWTIWSASQDQ